MKNIASLTANFKSALSSYAAARGTDGQTRAAMVLGAAKAELDLATGNLDCPRRQKEAQLKDFRKALAALEPKMSTFDIIGRILFAIIAAILLFSAGAGAVGIVMGAVPGGIILMAPAIVVGGLLWMDRNAPVATPGMSA